MKRFITSIFICTLLCSCGRLGDYPKDLSRQSGSAGNSTAVASKSPVVTESATETATAAESPVPTVNAGKPSGGKSVYVTDRTGQKCELKMGSVDVENKGGVAFSEIFVTADYAQVVDNHYYFMRSDGKRNYIVYRDKGEKEGAFSLKRGYVEDCALYKKKFYVIIRELPTNKKVSIREGRSLKLVEIDLKRQKMQEVCNCLTDLGLEADLAYDSFTPLGLYQGMFLYYCNDKLGRFDLEKKKVIPTETAAWMTVNGDLMTSWNWPCFGKKMYYAVGHEDQISIYRFDLKSGVREEVFRYNYVDVLGHPTEIETRGFGLDMDEDYIYCDGYGIPRRGGDMVRLFGYDAGGPPYAHNKKYVYYIYDAHRICRIDKKTLKRTLFRDTFVRDIKSTKDGLYVQMDDLEDYDSSEGCDSEDDGDDDEQESDIPDSCTLNFMDFDAKIVKRIWKGSESD